MENIWIFILFGVAFGAGTSIGNRIIAVLDEWINISIDYIFDRFVYNDKKDEETWN